MSPSASQPPLPAAAPRLTLARWLRIGLLLFVAQALALGLQALLLIHKEADLLTGLTASRIGKGGELRKGARLVVHVKGLPTTVLQKLEQPFVVKPSGSTATVRIGARDMQRIEEAATSVAGARAQASRVLRYASYGKGSVLAFGPSAAIDLYDSYTAPSGAGFATDFAVRSAKSQSGNAVAVGAGMLAVSAVGAVGAPAMLLALGVGVIVQTAWITLGGDEAAGNLVRGWLD